LSLRFILTDKHEFGDTIGLEPMELQLQPNERLVLQIPSGFSDGASGST
jgi:hypothetical protein